MRKLPALIALITCAAATAAFAQAKQAAPAKKAPAAPKAPAVAAPKNTIAKNPYIGAIVLDADTGKVLFEDKADIPGYPASTLKLMTLLVIQEKIDAGAVKLTDLVRVSAKAAKTGGSQVWLDPRENIRVEDLLHALMIKSANDAAVALAEHIAGSAEAFVALMNARAAQLGMANTRFASVHGLPPEAGQKHDVTTARDMGLLCLELCKHPAVFAYTSTPARQFRAPVEAAGENAPVYVPGATPIDMTTHNPFLKPSQRIDGCDGFKTGWTVVAGYSIAVTCKRGNRRVIAVVLGSDTLKTRDAKAKELLLQPFTQI